MIGFDPDGLGDLLKDDQLKDDISTDDQLAE
jgi:hypothetical protein